MYKKNQFDFLKTINVTRLIMYAFETTFHLFILMWRTSHFLGSHNTYSKYPSSCTQSNHLPPLYVWCWTKLSLKLVATYPHSKIMVASKSMPSNVYHHVKMKYLWKHSKVKKYVSSILSSIMHTRTIKWHQNGFISMI